MAGRTPNFELTTLSSGEMFSVDGYKYTDADRVLLDRLINAALTHDHSGVTAGDTSETVDDPPILTMRPDEGSLPAGTRLFYKIALVGSDGLATLASPETSIDTPLPIAAPDAPTASRSATAGTLLPGIYYYRLSAYRGASTLETAAGSPVSVPLPVGSTTNRVILTLPSPPIGADGYNLYRRIPGGSAFNHLATITVADIDDDWTDDGSTNPNCERFAPTRNTTSSSNSVTVAYPGGVIPDGYTWRIYRTDTAGEWSYSHLTEVAEETAEGSGIVTPTFLDLGVGTIAGTPPATTPPAIPTPTQISYNDLLDAPPAPPPPREAFPGEASMIITTSSEPATWQCPYAQAMIRSIHVNPTHAPSGSDMILAANQLTSGNPFASPITVPAGSLIGNAVPDTTARLDHPSLTVADLLADDILEIDITSGAGGVGNVTIEILLWIHDTEPEPTWPAVP